MWKSAVKVSLADHAAGAGSASTAYYCAASAAMQACRPGLQEDPVRPAWLSLHILRRRSPDLSRSPAWTRLLYSSFRNGQGCAYLIWQSFQPIVNFIWLPCLLCLAVISHAFRGSLTPGRQKRTLGALLLSWPAHLLLSLLFRSNRPMLNHS